MIDKALHSFLVSPQLLEHLAPYLDQYSLGGKVEVPKLVQAVVHGLPEDLKPHKNVVTDVIIGTIRARRLGKGLGGFCFTQLAAEQSTGADVAEYHAKHFDGAETLLEICGGVGVDTQAMAQVVGRVVVYESDPVHAALLLGNMRRAGVENVEVRCEAWSDNAVLPLVNAVWADPSRRTSKGRAKTVHEYSPPLAEITRWVELYSSNTLKCGIKVGPADSIQPNDGWSVESVGIQGECKEALLWYGMDKPRRVAHLVDRAVTEWQRGEELAQTAEVRMPVVGDYLVEPHSALIASGLLTDYFVRNHVAVLDRMIAYGTSPSPAGLSDWCAVFNVLRVESGINEKAIKKRIKDFNWNKRTEIKKRGVQIDPDSLHRSINFSASDVGGVVFLTRVGNKRHTIYAMRVINS